MAKKSSGMGREYRGGERRDVIINEYQSLDRLPMTLGQVGPVYRASLDDLSSQGYVRRAYDDRNER